MQASFLDCRMRDKNKADQLPKQKYNTWRGRGKKNAENKVAQTHYVSVHKFKMEGDVQALVSVSLSTWPQLIGTSACPTRSNQSLGARVVG